MDTDRENLNRTKDRLHSGGAGSILIVDDDPGVLYVLGRAFGPEYSICTATNGREAWESILANAPDLVITDLRMPVMNGLELLRQIRSTASVKDIPVIVVTGDFPGNSQLNDCLEFEGVGYLIKPFSCVELRRRVDAILCKHLREAL